MNLSPITICGLLPSLAAPAETVSSYGYTSREGTLQALCITGVVTSTRRLGALLNWLPSA